jgi:hypothetical protein
MSYKEINMTFDELSLSYNKIKITFDELSVSYNKINISFDMLSVVSYNKKTFSNTKMRKQLEATQMWFMWRMLKKPWT